MKIRLRGGSAAEWTSYHPILAAREIGVEVDTHKMKIGNGVDAWETLPYVTDAVANAVAQEIINRTLADDDHVAATDPHGDRAYTDAQIINFVSKFRHINTGTGLLGGGDLSADRTIVPDFGTGAGKVAQGNDSRFTDARTPVAHHTTHEQGGSDAVTLAESQVTNLVSDLASKADDVATTAALATKAPLNSPALTGTPTSPDPTTATGILNRETGDARYDAINAASSAVAAIPSNGSAGTPSLRSLGTTASNAAAGNDSRLSDARTPTAHAATHGNSGSDPVTILPGQVTGFDARVQTSRLDQMSVPTSDVNVNNHKIIGLASGTASTDAVNFGQMTAAVQGQVGKDPVDWTTDGNITLSGLGTQANGQWTAPLTNGVSTILAKNQTSSADDGIYVAGSGFWSRRTDTDTGPEITKATTLVLNGSGTSNHVGDTFSQSSTVVTIGSDAQNWVQTQKGNSTYQADATTVTLSGTTFSRSALTGDITAPAGSAATTLATVNSNVGTFGDATHVVGVTLDGKGRATAASAVPIVLPETAVTGLVSDLAAKADNTRNINTGTGLLGGGDLTSDRTLTPDFGTGAGKITQGNDSRLSDSRTPIVHHTTHEHGSADELVLDAAQIATGLIDDARIPTAIARDTEVSSAITAHSVATDPHGDRAYADSITVPKTRNIATGTGLLGGGDLTVDRTITPDFGTGAGKVTQGNDSRLSDARNPNAHAASHGSVGSDPVTVDESQVTSLITHLAAKAPTASPAFTGTPTAPTAVQGTSTTQVATTAMVASEVVLLAPKASPAFTGTPTAPTQAANDNSTKVATTAYADAAAAIKANLASPAFTGIPTAPTAAQGTNTAQLATTALVQSEVVLLAPKASPAFTGSPTAPTQAANDNSTKVATTAYADASLASKANLAGSNHFTGAASLFDNRPLTSEYATFSSIPVDGVTDASLAIAALSNDLHVLYVKPGEDIYIGPAAGTTLDLPNFEFGVLPGGLLRIDPTVVCSARLINPGLRTILDTRIQNITVTATGGTFALHGGNSPSGTGSTATVTVSTLTATTLQTAIRSLTGFNTGTPASVVSLGGGVYQVTFGSNLLTNLTVDPALATGGTVTIQRGTFSPVNQPIWDVQWWGQVNTFDDTATHLNVNAAVVASAYIDSLGSQPGGRQIRLPYGKNQFFGVTYNSCHLTADIASSVFFPPNWNPTSGTMLTLAAYSTLTGGTWRTAGSAQAVTLILMKDAREAVEDVLLANQAYGSIGIQAGALGMSGSTSPEVRRVRGIGNSTQRRITITATGGTIALRGGSLALGTPNTATAISLPTTAAALTTSIQTLSGFSGVASVSGTGPFTVTMPAYSFFDIDATLATGGTVTVEAFATGIQVNSPDFKGEDIILGSFKIGIQSMTGAGRLHKYHPFSCDYGLTGQLTYWTVDDPYWDTNNIWGMDAPDASGLLVNNYVSETNGFALGGGCMRIQQIAHVCSDNRLGDGVLDDDYGTMILIDGAVGTEISTPRLRSKTVKQSAGSPNATYGIHVTAASSGTKIKARASRSDFLTAPVLDEGSSVVDLGEFELVLAADLALPVSNATYGAVFSGTGPALAAGEIWDVSAEIFTDSTSSIPDIKNRIGVPVGCTGPLMMLGAQGPSNVSATFGNSQPANAVQCVNGNVGVVAGLGASRASTAGTGTTTSGSPTVTGTALALTGADVGRLVTSSLTGIPTPSYVGVVNSATSLDLSSSATSNIPVNATVTQTTATITIHTVVFMGLAFRGRIDNTAGVAGNMPWQAAQNTSDPNAVTIRKGSKYMGVRRA